VEPHEVDLIIRHLAATMAKQDSINDDLRTCIQEQRVFNADVRTTLARIETLLARMLPTGENGTDA